MFDPYWKDVDGYLRFEFADDKVYAHAEVTSWNKRMYVKCLAMWAEANNWDTMIYLLLFQPMIKNLLNLNRHLVLH